MKKFLLLLLPALAFTACDNEDPIIENEEEVITTLRYELTPVDGGAAVVFSFTDLDGEGGNDPVILSPTLAADTEYQGQLSLLNETDGVEDVNEEIEEEDDEHQVFYSSDVVTVVTTDTDGDGNPLGLTSRLTTGGSGTGSMTITLRHEPNKDAEGVSDGLIANAGGETDIEVQFNVVIE
jgi:hypothetical protein